MPAGQYNLENARYNLSGLPMPAMGEGQWIAIIADDVARNVCDEPAGVDLWSGSMGFRAIGLVAEMCHHAISPVRA